MWGLSPTDGNAAINAYKIAQGITNPCAGTEGDGPAAIDVVIEGQNFLGYPTYCVVCPDKSLFFDICWPPGSANCFDPYIEDCGYMALTANFSSDLTEVCQYDAVTYTDMSAGAVTSWNWTFEGGDPATSTEQNPVVTYNETGSYDVTLEVSDGTNSNTLFMEEYIEVMMTPPVMLLPFDDACLDDPPFELTGGSPAGGIYSGTGVNNGWFEPAMAGSGLHTITYTYAASNGCDNSADETILVDECTAIVESDEAMPGVHPNPTTGTFEIEFRHRGPVEINLVNMLGVQVAHYSLHSDGLLKQTVDIGNQPAGIYFVTVITRDGSQTRKIKLLNQ